ncbi:M48 family metallopeptidase [Rubritalea marina]|uniref:M48 family metallopeptidase n=1 Tax=Rubritalea marina TaxID=361055 RepID=UPI000369210A|nr:M48 family metallopeptidase [Rubritalea marina]
MRKALTSLLLASSFLFSGCVAPPAIDPQGNVRVTPTSSSLQSQGAQEFLKLKQAKKISKNSTYNAQLQRVARRLTPVINLPGAKWEFVVFEDKSPNAFALPGGKVGIHTGMFKITQTDAGLAAVVGHEIAHVTSNHAGKRQTQQIGLLIGAIALDQVVKNQGASGGERAAVAAGYGAVSTLGLALPYSRSHELEADKVGAIYMARAGYDPRDAVKMWRRFEAYNVKQGRSQPEFLSTHPLDQTRISALQSFMPTAMQQYRKR